MWPNREAAYSTHTYHLCSTHIYFLFFSAGLLKVPSSWEQWLSIEKRFPAFVLLSIEYVCSLVFHSCVGTFAFITRWIILLLLLLFCWIEISWTFLKQYSMFWGGLNGITLCGIEINTVLILFSSLFFFLCVTIRWRIHADLIIYDYFMRALCALWKIVLRGENHVEMWIKWDHMDMNG